VLGPISMDCGVSTNGCVNFGSDTFVAIVVQLDDTRESCDRNNRSGGHMSAG
jgi:hypothetical protein